MPGLDLVARGKVRDVYRGADDELLLVATDRISTYDAVHPTPVPDKGKVLTGVSAFWFGQLAELGPHHLLGTAVDELPAAARPHAEVLRGRVMRCRALRIVPFECVVRGYLAGSGWEEYRRSGTVCGIALPDGLELGSPLPTPIFTPATKAERGEHDVNVDLAAVIAGVGEDLAMALQERSLALYRAGAAHAAERGIILADTKFEFGLDGDELVLADEVLTPDSSRYWPADTWEPGVSPPSFDKQYVRDHVTASGWDRTPPAPALPAEVVASTRARYVEVYERLTGRSFEDWLAAP
ncbi:MAG: phosphoribosylaminoimidazolesuccinocarboxamide synthase [Nitriliruptoraceae bacterium]|nr:phosphoribosylaminoimidazolesuccinocarboxamide synthase [Nitriliruptoraceae bacterium]